MQTSLSRKSKSALIFTLAFVVYSNSIGNQFAFDDLIYIVNNPLVKSWSGFLTFFTGSNYPGKVYRPLTDLSYALTFQAFGLKSSLFHLGNVLLHALACVSAFLLLMALNFERGAFLAALLFAVHPLHSEVVANVVGRSESLAALFGICSLLCLARATRFSGLLSGVLFFCALLSKESAVCFGLLAVLVLWRQTGVLDIPKAMLKLCPLLFALAAFLALRYYAIGSIGTAGQGTDPLDNPLLALTALERAPIAISLLGKYLSMILAPFPLSADYSFPVINPQVFWIQPENLLNLLLLFCLVLAGLLKVTELHAASFGMLWFLSSFLITCNLFFNIGAIFAERFAYVPSLGIILLAIQYIQTYKIFKNPPLAFAFIAVVFSAQTVMHNPIWKDNASLHTYQASLPMVSVKSLVNYGVVLRNKGDLNKALELMHQALSEAPRFSNAMYGLASIYLMKNIYGGAEHWLHQALAIDPKHALSLQALGRLYLSQGKLDQAEEKFKQTLGSDSYNFDAKVGLLAILINRGKLQEAKIFRDHLILEQPQNQELLELSKRLNLEKTS